MGRYLPTNGKKLAQIPSTAGVRGGENPEIPEICQISGISTNLKIFDFQPKPTKCEQQLTFQRKSSIFPHFAQNRRFWAKPSKSLSGPH
jgi:hypothetical protein